MPRVPVDQTARAAIQRRFLGGEQRQQPHHRARARIDAHPRRRLAHEARRARLVDAQQYRRALVGGVERLPPQSATLARNKVDPVEREAGRARIGERRGKGGFIGAKLVGAVEPRAGKAEWQRHQAITSLKKVSPNLFWNGTESGGMICV